MRIWKWLEGFRKGKKENLNRRFAERVGEKYQRQGESRHSFVPLCHRKAGKSNTVIQQVNIQQIQQIIQKYMPKTTAPATVMVQRQERTRFLSMLESIGSQDGERKQLEQLIFRRKEQEWRKTIQVQEEEVRFLRQEVLHQKKVIETLEKRVSEPDIDVGEIYTEFRKRMEQQLHLERQRSGL